MSGTIYCDPGGQGSVETCAGILSPEIRRVTAIKSRFKERGKRLSSATPLPTFFFFIINYRDGILVKPTRVDKRHAIFSRFADPPAR